MSKQEVAWKIDSITKAQTVESAERARRDLEYRIKIDVKVKADSILHARQHPDGKSQIPDSKSQNANSKSQSAKPGSPFFPNKTK